MDKELKKAYTEALVILNHMDPKYKEKIPKKLIEQMERGKIETYDFKIDFNIPFKENKFSSKTMPLLAMLNLNYWCETEEEKKAQLAIHEANDKKQKEKTETPLVDKEEIVQVIEETGTEPFLWLALPEDTWFERWLYKIKTKIKILFSKRKYKE